MIDHKRTFIVREDSLELAVIMNIFRGYSLIVLTIIVLSASDSTVRATSLSDRIFGALTEFQFRVQRSCTNNTECLNNQKCTENECQAVCPGLCGTDALCRVKNHEEVCSCARCYEGNVRELCIPYPGFRYWTCLIWE